MTIGFETTVANVGAGDQILSPISGARLLVREVATAPFGMVDLRCTSVDGDRLVLTLDMDEKVKVLDA